MSLEKSKIDLLADDKGGFNFIYAEIEKMKIHHGEDNPPIQEIEVLTDELDRILQDISEESEKIEFQDKRGFLKNKAIVRESAQLLQRVFRSLRFGNHETIIRQLKEIKHAIDEAYKLNNEEEVIEYFSKKHKKLRRLEDRPRQVVRILTGLEKIKPIIKQDIFQRIVRICNPSNWFSKKKKSKHSLTWGIKIKFQGEEFHADKISFFLWSFSNMFSAIDGASIHITQFEQGSLIVKMKAFFNDVLAKEEAKEILEKARESAISYIEKPSAETQKIKNEGSKIEAEAEYIKKQSDAIPDKELSDEINALKNRKLHAEIQSLELDNYLKKVQVIERLSELAKEGILSVDNNFEILINDILYLAKDGRRYIKGVDIDQIDSKDELAKSSEVRVTKWASVHNSAYTPRSALYFIREKVVISTN